MNTESTLTSFTYPAGDDFSSLQYTAVSFESDGAVHAATAAKAITGVLQNNPASGRSASVAKDGITKARVGVGGVTAGDMLEIGTTGRFILHSSGYVVAQALEDGVEDDLISVSLLPSNALLA